MKKSKNQEARGKKQEAGSPPKGGTPSLGRVVIRRLAISAINEAAYNPRKRLRPGDAEWQELVASVKAFGYVDPLIWNQRTGNLVGGHQRLGVLRALEPGLKKIDVSVVDLDLVAEKALNLALNKVKGAWDDRALAGLLSDLAGEEGMKALGGMAVTGFSDADVKALTEEGARLVEMLVPKLEEEEKDEQEKEKDDEGAGKRPVRFNLLVACDTKKKQTRLYERLTGEGFACEMRTS